MCNVFVMSPIANGVAILNNSKFHREDTGKNLTLKVIFTVIQGINNIFNSNITFFFTLKLRLKDYL